MFRVRKVLEALFCLCFMFAQVAAENIGPQLRDTRLIEWRAALDKAGVDVRGNSNPSISPSRPVLMPLQRYESQVPLNLSNSKFAALFLQGHQSESVLLAVDGETGLSLSSETAFRTRWDGAASHKRVFISFSRQDVKVAEAVQQVLNASGYDTFMYLGNRSGLQPNAVDTGNYFREARSRYVIDTENARRSHAIAVEAFLARGGGRSPQPPPAPPPDFNPRILGGMGNGEPCCKLCRVVKGVIGSCGPVQCGPQCSGARGALSPQLRLGP